MEFAISRTVPEVSPDVNPNPSAGRHFAPASLLPYGGFGDPAVTKRIWRPPAGMDQDRVMVAQAQDRLVRRLRLVMEAEQLSESDLEQRLGYRERSFSRKLKGYELMTMRDVVRIASEFGGRVISSLVSEEDDSTVVVAESPPRYESRNDGGEDRTAVHLALQDAAARLRDASAAVRSGDDASLAETLDHVASVIIALGGAIDHGWTERDH